MNWTRIALAGIAAGVVTNVCEFIVHGLLLSDTYARLPEVFDQTQATPLYFLVIAVGMALAMAVLYAKTRKCLPSGVKGGATLGFLVGLFVFFTDFYSSLVIADFPYYLSWCWGTASILFAVVTGSVVALIYKD